MYCKKCGSLIVNGDSVCPNCGFQNVEETVTHGQDNMTVNPRNIIDSKKKKQPYWLIPIFLMGGGIFLRVIATIPSIYLDEPGEAIRAVLSFLSMLGVAMWFLFIPSIPLVIYLYCKKSKEETKDMIFQTSTDMPVQEQLISAYIGQNYDKIMKQKFSFSAFFLNWIYMLYRKIYGVAVIIGIIFIIIGHFLPLIQMPILILIMIVSGMNFNKWYVSYVKKQVENIKNNNPNQTSDELISLCQKKGGTSVGIAILIYIVIVVVCNLLFSSFSTRALDFETAKLISKKYYHRNASYITENENDFDLLTAKIGILIFQEDSVSSAKDTYLDVANGCGGLLGNLQNLTQNKVSCIAEENDTIHRYMRIKDMVMTIRYYKENKDDTVLQQYLKDLGMEK